MTSRRFNLMGYAPRDYRKEWTQKHMRDETTSFILGGIFIAAMVGGLAFMIADNCRGEDVAYQATCIGRAFKPEQTETHIRIDEDGYPHTYQTTDAAQWLVIIEGDEGTMTLGTSAAMWGICKPGMRCEVRYTVGHYTGWHEGRRIMGAWPVPVQAEAK